MNGLYLYCIRNNEGKGLRVKGMDGKSNATSVPYKDIEAIVSKVDLKEFGSKELAVRAKEDLKWIIKHAQRHEKVIEAVMGIKKSQKIYNPQPTTYNLNPVIPMKFGMMFEKPQGIEDILKKKYKRFKNLLAHLTGKQEWGVKVYAKEEVLKDKFRSNESNVRAQVKLTKKLPRGADYFGELKEKDALDTVMQDKIDEFSEKFFLSIAAFALESRQSKILVRELSGHEEPMILNCAYLIQEDKVPIFIKEIKNLQKLNPEFIFEHTGPWPPYNFVK